MNYLAFFISTILICLSPGPSVLTVSQYTAQAGFSAGFRAASGVVIADALLLILCFSGLGQLVLNFPQVYGLLKTAGSLFLIYLGIKALANRHITDKHSELVKSPFVTSLSITLFNPKILLFLTACLPQYMDPDAAMLSQAIILSLTFLLVVSVTCTAYIFVTGLARRQAGMQTLSVVLSGICMIICGAASLIWQIKGS